MGGITVAYGTHTGTAAELALDACAALLSLSECDDDLSRVRLTASWCSLKLAAAAGNKTVFFVSTAGQGEFPVAVQEAWDELQSAAWPTSLTFTVFGLGDSRYPKFNFAARKLRALLLARGAKEFYRCGLGDAQHQHDVYAEYDAWLPGLLQSCCGRHSDARPSDSWSARIMQQPVFPRYRVAPFREVLTDADDKSHDYGYAGAWTKCTVEHSHLLTAPGHKPPVALVTVKLPAQATWTAGDCIAVSPRIDEEAAMSFIADAALGDPLQKVTLHEAATFQGSDDSVYSQLQPPLPNEPITLLELFTQWFDWTAVASRQFFRVLALAAAEKDNELHRAKLVEIGSYSSDGRELYLDYCKAERRNYAEVLWDFLYPLPLSQLINCLPRIAPRLYSIANHRCWYDDARRRLLWPAATPLPSTVAVIRAAVRKHLRDNASGVAAEENALALADLCVCQIRHTTRSGREVLGLASSYILRISAGHVVHYRLLTGARLFSGLQMRKTIRNGPLLVVATGTGVAPARAVLQTRALNFISGAIEAAGAQPAPNALVVQGCRHPEQDFLFAAEWRALERAAALTHVPAFSRKDPASCEYVQNVLESRLADVVADFFRASAVADCVVLICGKSTPMPQQVLLSLRDVLARKLFAGDTQKADQYMNTLEKRGNVVFDTWG